MSVWPKVAVVGGSIGGLTAALVLRDLGCEVDVFERTREMGERSQFRHDWTPGDPTLRLGLYGPGR